MKEKCCAVLLCFLMISCLGVVDTKNNKPVTKFSQTNLLGEWKADKFSYEYTTDFIKNKKQKLKDSISLLLKTDGTFIFNNGIEILEDSIIQKNYTGTWKLAKRIQKGYENQFEIRFRSNNGFGGMPSRIPIYKTDKEYELFIFIGDPDIGERIGFKKKVDK